MDTVDVSLPSGKRHEGRLWCIFLGGFFEGVWIVRGDEGAGQGGSGAGDARGLPLPPKPVVRESTGAAPIPAPPRSSTSAAGERTVARAPPPPPQAPSNTLPSPPLLSAVNAGTVARAVPQGRALPAPSNSQSSAPVGHGMASGPPVPPPIAFRPQMQGPGAPLRPPAGGRPAALPTLRAGSPAPVPVNRMGLLRGSHSLPPAAEEDSSAQVSERDLSSAQSLPFVAPPAFGSAGLDDDSSFFSDYGEGALPLLLLPRSGSPDPPPKGWAC